MAIESASNDLPFLLGNYLKYNKFTFIIKVKWYMHFYYIFYLLQIYEKKKKKVCT